MQLKKPAVLAAIGAAALAAAAIGAPAQAAPADAQTRATMLDLLSQQMNSEPQALAAAGTGSAVHAAPWQVCSSAAVAGVGGVVDLEPDTILGDCNNANVTVWQDTVNPAISALNDSAIIAAPWQVCSSSAVGGVGGTVSVQAPKTIFGKCSNANVKINVPDDSGYGESGKATIAHRSAGPARTALAAKTRIAPAPVAKSPADLLRAHMYKEPQSLASAGSGSAIIAAPWQVCGSASVAGVGGVVVVQSGNAMYGDCDNANAHIRQDDPTAAISVLDNSHVTAAAWQVCGSDSVAGVGGVVNVGSPNIVMGSCNNANTIID